VIEKELLKGAQNYNQPALAEIYDRFSPGLYRYAVRLLGEADLAEDCVSETFNRFLSALQQRKGPREHLQAYLYRIAHNWITDHYRNSFPLILPLVPELTVGFEEDPAQVMIRLVEHQLIRGALSRLTPDQRQVLVLKFVEDWDNAEIAAALNRSVGSVKALQHRALENLRRILRAQEISSYEKE
jgi:RNA polymerase sigma-70 factor, ECF subfamily